MKLKLDMLGSENDCQLRRTRMLPKWFFDIHGLIAVSGTIIMPLGQIVKGFSPPHTPSSKASTLRVK